MSPFHLQILEAAFAILASIAAGVWCTVSAGIMRFRYLPALDGKASGDEQLVSVVIAARNESSAIQRTLQALSASDYRCLEILVVDDRSVDATFAQAQLIAQRDERIQLFRIETIPSGWFGKTYALWLGAKAARGSYILFADADVVLSSNAIGSAVRFMRFNEVDHLTLFPRVIATSWMVRSALPTLFSLYFYRFKPWLAVSGRTHAGNGAFNMVRADTYWSIGGHESIRDQVLDDLELGRIIREAKSAQRALLAGGLATVEWYDTVQAMYAGLRKNTWRLMDRSAVTFAGCILTALVWAFGLIVGLSSSNGFFVSMSCVLLLIIMMTYGLVARVHSWPLATFLLAPVGTLIASSVITYGVVYLLVSGKIEWRGRFYDS